MTSESEPSDQASASVGDPKAEDPTRGRSTIEFPYFDLASAIEMAAAIKAIGGTSAEWRQLAVKLSMAPDGGGFRGRLIAAKTFGLLKYARGIVELTDLGLRVADPQYERSARVESFLSVALYKALFDRLNGQTLPPPPAVERMAQQVGVAPKQADKARQAFMRSAKTAGLFELSADRLSLPPGMHQPQARPATNPSDDRPKDPGGSGSGSGGGGGNALHPFIVGLLHKLPAPESDWQIKDRAKWLETAANIFDLMYSNSGTGFVRVTYEP